LAIPVQPNKIDPNEFAIRWRGAVIAEETGDYEFCLKRRRARLWVNNRIEDADRRW